MLRRLCNDVYQVSPDRQGFGHGCWSRFSRIFLENQAESRKKVLPILSGHIQMEMSITHFRLVCISSFQCAYNFTVTSNGYQRRVSISYSVISLLMSDFTGVLIKWSFTICMCTSVLSLVSK